MLICVLKLKDCFFAFIKLAQLDSETASVYSFSSPPVWGVNGLRLYLHTHFHWLLLQAVNQSNHRHTPVQPVLCL